MAKLIYPPPTSLDGYIADETGDFDWAAPDEEGFAFINDRLGPSYMYLRTKDVRDDGDLGDARRHSWPDAGHDGLRADLARWSQSSSVEGSPEMPHIGRLNVQRRAPTPGSVSLMRYDP